MVGTVGAARGLGGWKGLLATGTAFALGLAAGSGLVFGGLGLVAVALDPGRPWIVAAAVLAVIAAASDAAGLRVRPQLRFQVPERWRRRLPLPLAVFLYGLLLGTGFTTYVPAAAVWALVALSLALGSLATALAIGLALAAGRALPILVLAPRSDGELLAERPGALRLVRILAAGALAVGVAAVLAGPAAGATIVAAPGGDPSVAAADVAWQVPGTGGFFRRGDQTAQLPGADPALGGALVAWHAGDDVTVAARDTLAPVLSERIVGVEKLAVSDRWLAFRVRRADGSRRLYAQSLTDTAQVRTVATAAGAVQIGRPVLAGDVLVFHVATVGASWITALDLVSGKSRRLRSSKTEQLLHPALLGSRLLYVRVSRCSQQLRLGRAAGGRERVLLALPPQASWDRGREPGHTSQGSATPCPGRPRATTTILWTTALTSRFAYVTTLRRRAGGQTTPTLLRIAR
jgi:hypothetical protein